MAFCVRLNHSGFCIIICTCECQTENWNKDWFPSLVILRECYTFFFVSSPWLKLFRFTFFPQSNSSKASVFTSFARRDLISTLSFFLLWHGREHLTDSHFSLFVVLGHHILFSNLSWSGLSEDSWCKVTDGWGETMRVSRSLTQS